MSDPPTSQNKQRRQAMNYDSEQERIAIIDSDDGSNAEPEENDDKEN